MPIVLYRVDERLIHGQVIVGWGAVLHPDRIVVVDDQVAESAWERELYAMGLGSRLQADFVGVREAATALAEWKQDPRRTIVLTRDVAAMRRLAEGGALDGETINIGGIHHAPGRREVLPYVFLSSTEAEELRELEALGAHVVARDLPGSREVSLPQLVRGGL
ncbi:MAG: PTS system mannose/fructose/N-acetylgalactosamine-transporter subunit IIB [Longimicrobiales bacterium]